MLERSLLERVSKLPLSEHCLKNPNYKCECCLADPKQRRSKLAEIRKGVGMYSWVNLLDEEIVYEYIQSAKAACEGSTPEPDEVLDQLDMFKDD